MTKDPFHGDFPYRGVTNPSTFTGKPLAQGAALTSKPPTFLNLPQPFLTAPHRSTRRGRAGSGSSPLVPPARRLSPADRGKSPASGFLPTCHRTSSCRRERSHKPRLAFVWPVIRAKRNNRARDLLPGPADTPPLDRWAAGPPSRPPAYGRRTCQPSDPVQTVPWTLRHHLIAATSPCAGTLVPYRECCRPDNRRSPDSCCGRPRPRTRLSCLRLRGRCRPEHSSGPISARTYRNRSRGCQSYRRRAPFHRPW